MGFMDFFRGKTEVSKLATDSSDMDHGARRSADHDYGSVGQPEVNAPDFSLESQGSTTMDLTRDTRTPARQVEAAGLSLESSEQPAAIDLTRQKPAQSPEVEAPALTLEPEGSDVVNLQVRRETPPPDTSKGAGLSLAEEDKPVIDLTGGQR